MNQDRITLSNGGEGNWEGPVKPEWQDGPLSEDGPNPYQDGEAIRQFEALYTGKQRRDAKAWLDYFTSEAFLDAAWDRRFTALLLERVTALEEAFPPGKEFLTWLHVAYQFAEREGTQRDQETMQVIRRERRFHLYPEADFDGMDCVIQITAKGPVSKEPRGNELALLQSFQDYRHLVRLARRGVWSEAELEEYKWILGRYVPAYIKERCEQRVALDCERHPAGLRVFVRFFQRRDLPKELYRIAWNRLDLKSAVLGRGKVLYGTLRELVVQRLPGIDGEVRENYFQLNQARDACQARLKAAPGEGETELDRFFNRPDVQRALRSQQFIKEQLLEFTNWLNWLAGEDFIRRILNFYWDHPEIPGWEQVVEKAERELEDIAAVRRSQAQAQEAAARLPEKPDLSLLQEIPGRVYAQDLDGTEWVVRLIRSDPKEYGRELEDEDPAEALTGEELDQRLEEWLDRFGQGEVQRLELEFYTSTLVLIRDGEQYACFYFLARSDTWYTMLSQPEVYQHVDSKDVEYLPFRMGRMASYNIHQSPETILSNLSLVFTQIGQNLKVRVGDCWLWSSTTHLQNGHFKKRMAMQKLAGFPPERSGDYILTKFVLSQQPVQMESVTLNQERTLTEIGRSSFGLAAGALVQFMQQKLARLRLTWTFQTPGGEDYQRHLVLLWDKGASMMLWLQDDRERAEAYAAAPPSFFLGYIVPNGLVHNDLKRIRNGLDLLLDDLSSADLVTERPGEFVPITAPYGQLRAKLVQGQDQQVPLLPF